MPPQNPSNCSIILSSQENIDFIQEEFKIIVSNYIGLGELYPLCGTNEIVYK